MGPKRKLMGQGFLLGDGREEGNGHTDVAPSAALNVSSPSRPAKKRSKAVWPLFHIDMICAALVF